MSAKRDKEWQARVERREALEKERLTQEERDRWAEMFHQTWQAIGGDVEVALSQSKVRLTKAILVETVCDCGYVKMYGDMTDAEYEFFSAISQRPSFKAWLRKELNYV